MESMYGAFPGVALGGFAAGIIVLAAWSLVWKGIALWHAARGGEKVWFIVFLIVNTAGILEILYIFFFRKNRATKNAPAAPSSTPVQ